MMNKINLFMILIAALFSVPVPVLALGETGSRIISVIDHGKPSASFTFPGSVNIDVSADQEKVTTEGNTHFKGDVKVIATFSTGEVMTLNAKEIELVTAK